MEKGNSKKGKEIGNKEPKKENKESNQSSMNKKELKKNPIKDGEKAPLPKNPEKITPQNEVENEEEEKIVTLEEEKKEKTFMKKYISEDNKNYVICFEETKSEMIISLTNQNEDSSPFVSRYELDYLNEKFEKIIQFKSIEEFRMCLKVNVEKKSLIIKAPYKNVINTVWKIFPNDNKNSKTFTLTSSQSWEKNLSLLFYSNYKRAEKVAIEIEKQIQVKPKQKKNKSNYLEQTYDKLIENMIFLDDQYDNNDNKLNIFKDVIKANIDEREKRNIKFRNILIFFDDKNEKNLFDDIIDIIKQYLDEQIFIIIFSSGNIEDLRYKIFKKIDKFNENKKCYFDMNNVFIYKNESNEYKKILMVILKIFSYFNQLGDGFFKQISEMGLKLENLENEFKYLYNTHYFNILLCGRTGAGKSTFINTIMGEKKSFTLKNVSAGTYRSNYYIHKKYPIKIIDVCGFASGNEAAENLERLKLIYNKDSNNIFIDEYTNDSFSFYGDKRNNIHLLLYFNIYNDKYDVVPGELGIILEAIEKKIPIIFIVNKCPDDTLDDEEEKNDLIKEVKKARKGTDYEKYETYLINCIKKKGFDDLLGGIFNKYKEYIISNDDLKKMKDNSINEEDFKKLFKNSIFFGNINPKDVFLNESLLNSVIDIKSLIVKLAGYYSKELGIFRSLGFYLFTKLYNNIHRNAETNFFPLLTDLVKKIYQNFGIKKNNKECNDYIIKKLSNYFKIKLEKIEDAQSKEEEEEEKDNEEEEVEEYLEGETATGNEEENNNDEFDFEQFKKDYINFGKLYWFSKKNFKLDKDQTEDILKNTNNNLGEKIFKFEDDDEIKPERILLLLKRDFGLDNSKRDANSHEKIILKLFYISYVSNELISNLCGKMNHKGFKYHSIFNFYHTVSKLYNDAINGFIKIKDEIKNNGKNKVVDEPAPNPSG